MTGSKDASGAAHLTQENNRTHSASRQSTPPGEEATECGSGKTNGTRPLSLNYHTPRADIIRIQRELFRMTGGNTPTERYLDEWPHTLAWRAAIRKLAAPSIASEREEIPREFKPHLGAAIIKGELATESTTSIMIAIVAAIAAVAAIGSQAEAFNCLHLLAVALLAAALLLTWHKGKKNRAKVAALHLAYSLDAKHLKASDSQASATTKAQQDS